jgi:hypothetical protein
MLVSYKYNFIYVKTIKTAGTSTEIFLEPYCVSGIDESHGRDMINTDEGIIGCRNKQKKAEMFEFYNHIPPYELKQKIDNFDNFIKICNVRNPFDMIVSHYYFRPTYVLYTDKDLSFEEYMFETDFIKDFSYKCKNLLYINNDFIIDEVIRFENLETDLYSLVDKLKLPKPERELKEYKKNKKRIKGYKKLYNKEIKRLVEDAFDFYLDKFEYKF